MWEQLLCTCCLTCSMCLYSTVHKSVDFLRDLSDFEFQNSGPQLQIITTLHVFNSHLTSALYEYHANNRCSWDGGCNASIYCYTKHLSIVTFIIYYYVEMLIIMVNIMLLNNTCTYMVYMPFPWCTHRLNILGNVISVLHPKTIIF